MKGRWSFIAGLFRIDRAAWTEVISEQEENKIRLEALLFFYLVPRVAAASSQASA